MSERQPSSTIGWIIRLSAALFCLTAILTAISLALGAAIPSEQIAYKDGRDTLIISLLDVQRQLTHEIYSDETPTDTSLAWSPSGDRLALVSQRDGNEEVYVIRPGGREVQNVTRNPAREYAPTWLDDQRVAFWTSRDSGNRSVYTALLDDLSAPAQRIVNPLTPNADARFAWSPDAQRFALVSYRDGTAEIYVRDFTETQSRQLTDNDAFDNNPVWSPDGTRLAFWTNRDSGHMRLYVMNADGSDVHPITEAFPSQRDFSWSAAWSPDGERIAFVAMYEGIPAIYTIRTDGSEMRRVLFIDSSGYPPALAWRP